MTVETGEDESGGGEDMFGEDALDPLALLEDMEREAGEAGDVGARQPYQVCRHAARSADSSDSLQPQLLSSTFNIAKAQNVTLLFGICT